MQKDSREFVFERQRLVRILFAAAVVYLTAAQPMFGQDDVTTQNATSALGGAWITGPASNPLSHLNGPAFRTDASTERYDFADFAPFTRLDAKMPRWIAVHAEERFRGEGYRDGSFKAGNDDNYLLNRFRLAVDVRAGTWFRVSAQVQDARPFLESPPIGPPNENCWDLKLAYAEIGAPEHHWFSLRAGRQIINYNNTIVANSEWRNQARSYDAAVLNLQSRRAALGIFAASAVAPQASGVSPHHEGNNIYGLYGRINNPLRNSTIEPFVLWRVQPNEVMQAALSKAAAREDMHVEGFRIKGRVASSLDYSGELVFETGSVGAEPIRAWATTEGAAYQFREARGRPRLFTQYDFASGTGNPGGGVHRTFDTMYPTAHDRFGILDQFGWQNLQSARAGGTFEPHRRWSVSAQALDFWADSALDAIYNTSGVAIGANKSAHGKHIGEEADGYTWYELNRHFNVGGGYGWFGGGDFLSHIASSHSYSSYYFVLNFKDDGRRPKQ